MELPFDDDLVPNGYELHPQIRDEVAKLERHARLLDNYDALLLRRQIWLLREVLGKLREAKVPDTILENLHAVGDVVVDLFPHNTIDFGMDSQDPEFLAAMPSLPDTFQLRLADECP